MMKYQCNPLARLGMTAMLLIAAVALSPADPVELVSPNAQDIGFFGMAVAGIEDINGNSRGDVIIGAYRESGATTIRMGRVYIFEGSTGNLIRTLESPNSQSNGRFGSSVADVPDVNGDGHPDIVVGAPGEDEGWGRVYLFDGTNGNVLQTIEFPDKEATASGRMGLSVTGIPDLSGDGRGDIAAGYGDSIMAWVPGPGGVLIFNGATGALIHSLESPNPEEGGNFGSSLSGIEDVNDDGRGDLIVGAGLPLERSGAGGGEFKVYLFNGFTGSVLHTFISPNDGNGFGYTVSDVPDVNGDEVDDVIVGAGGESGTFVESGRAYIFNADTGGLIRTLESPNEEEYGYFGISVSGIVDMSEDGKGDVIIGAQGEDETGRAYLMNSATGSMIRMYSSPNAETFDEFGCSVSDVPDVNGDGGGDMIIGSPYEDVDTATSAGRAYIFHGGASNVGQWRSY